MVAFVNDINSMLLYLRYNICKIPTIASPQSNKYNVDSQNRMFKETLVILKIKSNTWVWKLLCKIENFHTVTLTWQLQVIVNYMCLKVLILSVIGAFGIGSVIKGSSFNATS